MERRKIHIDEPNRVESNWHFVGERQRLATLTGVRFVEDNRLVATHLVGQKIYLFDFNQQDDCNRKLNSIETQYNGKATGTDLLDYDGANRLLTSNFNDGSGSLYEINDLTLQHVKDFPLPDSRGNCHGARFYDRDTVCLTTNKNELWFVDIETALPISKIQMPFHIKDLCFIDDKLALAPFALNSPANSEKPAYASGLLYFSFDLKNSRFSVIDKCFLKPCAFDAISWDETNERFIITDQYGDRLIVASLASGRIEILGQVDGFSFPHGLDCQKDRVAVTNYGKSSIDIFPISQLPVKPFTGKFSRWRPDKWAEFMRLSKYYI